MNTKKPKLNDHLLTPIPSCATNNLIKEMVEVAEQEMEYELQKKRQRLKYKLNAEMNEYQQEIKDNYELQRKYEFNLRRENLEKMRIDRELDRQKFVEMKQLQQHLQNSEELRLDASKRLLDECIQTQKEQVKEKLRQEFMIREMEQSIHDEEKRKREKEDWEKEQEAEQIRMQKKLEVRRQLEVQNMRKIKIKRNNKEIERKLMQETDEILKKMEDEAKKTKQREYLNQQEFLKRQIEQRRSQTEFDRQQKIEYEKAVAAMAKQQLENEAVEKVQAKRMQQMENLQFIDYMKRLRLDDIEAEQFDPNQMSIINEEIDTEAEMKRMEKRQQLKKEKHSEYLKQLHQRHVVKEQQKQREVLEFLETEKQNVEYDEMMANLKARNRLQIQQDLDTQIKLKHMDMVRKMEDEIKCKQQFDEMKQSSSMLTEKIRKNNVDGLIKEHPFYKCLKNVNT